MIAELNADAGAKVAKELGCESAACNVAKKADWESLLKRCMEKYGGVDVVINNAGFSYSKKVRQPCLLVGLVGDGYSEHP